MLYVHITHRFSQSEFAHWRNSLLASGIT